MRARTDLAEADIVAIAIESFKEAIDLGSQCSRPGTTDEAQYSLPYAVAAVLVHGRLGAHEIGEEALRDPRIKRLLEKMTLTNDAEFSARFPAERWARVRITLRDGRTLVSEPARARGNPENPLSDDELRIKYRALAEPVLGTLSHRSYRNTGRLARQRRRCAGCTRRCGAGTHRLGGREHIHARFPA